MNATRDAFLRRVRQALREGNRAGQAVPLEARGKIGYQGAGPDPASRFCEELTAAGGHAHRVPDREAAIAQIRELVRAASAQRILLAPGAVIDTLDLPGRLADLACELVPLGALPPEAGRDVFFAADLAITGVDFLIAETGTIVLGARPDEPRSLSLLPPVHIAVAEQTQLLPDLFDLFEAGFDNEQALLPSCWSLITGPSKTGDIELRLVTGVHGPGELHVILIR